MLLQYIINGLNIGKIYILTAIDCNIIYDILNLLTFAHGDVYAVGCFVTFALMCSSWSGPRKHSPNRFRKKFDPRSRQLVLQLANKGKDLLQMDYSYEIKQFFQA